MTGTTAARRAQRKSRTDRKQSFLERQGWIDAIQCRRDLSLTARLVGGRLGMHKNLLTERCDPGAGTLAAEAGISERAAFRAIAELERKGCIAVERTRGGARNNANRYTLIPQTNPGRGDTVSGVSARVRGDKRDTAPLTPCHANKEEHIPGDAKASPRVGRESRELTLACSPGGGRLDGAAPEELEESKRTPEEEILPLAEIIPPSRVPSLDRERFWRDLRALWERPHAEDQRADRKAFDVACGEVAPEVILAAAPAWLEAYEPRYRQPLWKWLGDHGWEKPPPQRKGARGGGRRSNGRKPDMSVVGLTIAQRYEAEEAARADRRTAS
jgi:hypothetical protein